MSNIRINYLSYNVVPMVVNGNTPVLANNPYRVEPISPVNTNIGYNHNNSNNSSTGYKHSNSNNGSNLTFKEVLEEKMEKQNGLGRKK